MKIYKSWLWLRPRSLCHSPHDRPSSHRATVGVSCHACSRSAPLLCFCISLPHCTQVSFKHRLIRKAFPPQTSTFPACNSQTLTRLCFSPALITKCLLAACLFFVFYPQPLEFELPGELSLSAHYYMPMSRTVLLAQSRCSMCIC